MQMFCSVANGDLYRISVLGFMLAADDGPIILDRICTSLD